MFHCNTSDESSAALQAQTHIFQFSQHMSPLIAPYYGALLFLHQYLCISRKMLPETINTLLQNLCNIVIFFLMHKNNKPLKITLAVPAACNRYVLWGVEQNSVIMNSAAV